MIKRILALILLVSIIIYYFWQPYYGGLSAEILNFLKYTIGILGFWAGLKLIL